MLSNILTIANFWRLVRQLVFYGLILAVWQLLYKLEIWSPTQAPEEVQADVCAALPELRLVPFRFEAQGSKIIYIEE